MSLLALLPPAAEFDLCTHALTHSHRVFVYLSQAFKDKYQRDPEPRNFSAFPPLTGCLHKRQSISLGPVFLSEFKWYCFSASFESR